ncbi:PREDICTED: mucin-2-like [Ceratosolen solmsi marchali]|uniref:Mucin-2-like n=1 Tax=Ceratosolen solmsi marchali TaxID=326594 RepID=A0AAJ7E0J3_9HYME|nr:PREDICTED: mucin-2-like [Ceratosolen solmsi marchali]
MGSRTRRRWLIFAILGALAAGLGDATPPPSSPTKGKRTQNEIETSTIAITSLRMYHLDPPSRRRFLSASLPSPTLTVGTFDDTESAIVQEPTKISQIESHQFNAIKEDDVFNWLHGLTQERKRLFLDKIGCTSCTCPRSCTRRKCKKTGHLTPESRNLEPPPPPPPESDIITTTSTSPPPPPTTTTPEPMTTIRTTTTSTTTTTLRPTTTTTTTTTELPLSSSKSTPKLIEPIPTPKFIDYSSVPTPKKEKSKCRRKKKGGKGAN